MKRFGVHLLRMVFFTIGSGFVYADRYGLNDITDDDPPMPLWLLVYIFAGSWLCLGEKSPLKNWAEKNAGFSLIIFLVTPAVVLVVGKLIFE